MEIIPAILPKDFGELEEKIELAKGAVSLVQIDICDGKFTPVASWPYKKHDMNFDAILHEEKGMPYWEDVDVEFDLMVKDPENDINNWITAGATRIIIHAESTQQLKKLVDDYADSVEIGVALSIGTPISVLEPVIADISFVQCMGIKRIGFQGEPFDPRVCDLIRNVKASYPSMTVSVDGGVNPENAELLRDAGADRLIVGSAFFEADNPVEMLRGLEAL